MPQNNPPIESPPDREIVSTRVFAAPRELVWRAFADPAQLARWWGPKGFTNTIHEFDFRPGGWWRFVMHAPNGADYPNESEFTAVAKPERIDFVHQRPVHRFQMTMLFADRRGQTELTWRMLFDTVADCEPIRRFITEANEQNFDRLAAHLSKTTLP
jgi:uncharacterized protein YndB with AHSA1/START domain